ncbi:MAG: hypothetical protein WED01_02080 [Candidatus Rokuibacteriota bacterium]
MLPSRHFQPPGGPPIELRRPPLAIVLVAVLVIALGETGGAAMSQLAPAVERYATARVDANAEAHGLLGSPEYDDEVRSRAVYSAEAGLSFFHTHAEGLGLILFFTSTLVASVVAGRRVRAALYALLTAGSLFPLGYLAYSVAVLELGRDSGIEAAERWVLIPLGSAAIVGLAGLAVCLTARVRAAARPSLP